jgi:hypothetical protein
MFHKIPFDTSLLIKTTWDFCPWWKFRRRRIWLKLSEEKF